MHSGPDRHPRELDHRVGRQHPDDRRGAADRQALDRLAHQLGVADRLEGVVDPGAAGQCAHRLDRVVLGAVDEICGAGPHRHLALGVEHVDGDDLAGAADARALDDRQPDPAAAEHRDGLAGLEPGVRRAAPTPVNTPQPTSAALSSGSSGSIRTIEFSCSSIFSA